MVVRGDAVFPVIASFTQLRFGVTELFYFYRTTGNDLSFGYRLI